MSQKTSNEMIGADQSGVFVHVVDDDDGVRAFISHLLSDAGFAIRTYASATQFFAEGGEDAVGCVVTDVRMPGLNGVDLVRKLTAHGGGQPVIVISGGGDVGLAVEAMQAGAVDFVQKPFRGQALIEKVTAALDACDMPLMSNMLAAIGAGEIEVHYQPKLDLRLGVVTAVEALVRWRRPGRRLLTPDAFIPAAERTGHIRELTDFVLQQAVTDQAAMMAKGRCLGIAVNISGRILGDLDFADFAARAVGAACGPISFEITETAIMKNPEQAQVMFRAFAEAGVRISIDDFGAGLSSLAYVQSIPAQELKLDRVMVRDVATHARDAVVVKAAIALAHSLGMEAVAEGVEDRDCLASLIEMGCDHAQGYFIARPVPLSQLIEPDSRAAEAIRSAA
jgi:EAL domain-containing protein (putative c-di-GMP-specific phosphodiesterase class I)/ActR/RegA family two-component response regulator